jgi:hypothetical protein
VYNNRLWLFTDGEREKMGIAQYSRIFKLVPSRGSISKLKAGKAMELLIVNK